MYRKKTLSRRNFIGLSVLTGATFFVGTSIQKWNQKKQFNQASEFLAAFGELVPIPLIEALSVNLEIAPSNKNELVIQVLILADIESNLLFQTNIANSVETRIKSDYSIGNTIQVDNWVLAKTEAKLYLIASKYVHLM